MKTIFNDNFTREHGIEPIEAINDMLFDYIFDAGRVELTPCQSAVISGLLTKIGEICNEHKPI
ncbi:MAG: hypothetical protein HWE26_05040 [Alteromonadaceae bacterium]|nr:hypothetical protein [Alteromonadaceae bacterium]